MTDERREYRVWNVINPPNSARHYTVPTPEVGAAVINALAAEQLRDPFIQCNAFGLEVLAEDGWEEWYDERGDDVDELCYRLIEEQEEERAYGPDELT